MPRGIEMWVSPSAMKLMNTMCERDAPNARRFLSETYT